jgi:phospholipase D1/2
LASAQNVSYFSGPLQRPTPSIDFENNIQTFHNSGGLILSGQGKKAKHSLRFHLLYGTLDLYIHSAKNLPNMDMFSERLRQVFTAGLPNIVKTGIPIVSKVIKSDPYVCLILGGACLARTDVISNSSDPVWNQHFVVNVAHKVAEIEFLVKDNDMIGAQYIGEVKIPSERLLTSPHAIVNESFPLLNRDGKPSKQGAELCISVTYWPIAQDPLYRYGVGMDHFGVHNAYFPLRRGCRLTLYQDAHMSHEFQPPILLAGGRRYEPRSCWDDICQAILDAQHLIYIAGWSIYTEITLVRDKERGRPDEAYLNLGELLKWKAQSGGVRVLLLVWDDRTSSSFHKV